VGGPVLGMALVAGAVLVVDQPMDGPLVAASAVASALVVTTAVGVLQARRMTQLRLWAAGGAKEARGCRQLSVAERSEQQRCHC
jgi:hypothetical protein